MRRRDHLRLIGDVANVNRLEQLASQTKKDLNFVQLAEMSHLQIPKFHYETKPFTIVQLVYTTLSKHSMKKYVVL